MHKLWKSIGGAISGELSLRVANLAAAVVVGRLYGAGTLGIYASAVAFATVILCVADNGMQIQIVPEMSRNLSRGGLILAEFYSAKTILFFITAVICGAFALALHVRWQTFVIFALVIVKMMGYSFGQINFGTLKASYRAHAIGFIQGTHSVILLVVIGITYYCRWTLITMLQACALAQVAEFAVSYLLLHSAGLTLSSPSRNSIFDLLRRSAPIGAVYVLAATILRADILILGLLTSGAVIGNFAAANQIIVVIYMAAWQLGSVLLPHLVAVEKSGHDALNKKLSKLTSRSWVPVALATILGALASPTLIRVLYGQAYREGGVMASIMILAAPFLLYNAVYFNGLLARQETKSVVTVYGAAALITIVLDVVLGWRFGAFGISAAIVVREALLAFCWQSLLNRSPQLEIVTGRSLASHEANSASPNAGGGEPLSLPQPLLD